ncbi:MAG: 2-hydroxyacyl-CoA dehydratase family protein [Candidatus Geothermincolales bacterium]
MEGAQGNVPEVNWFCTYTPVEILEAAGLSHRRLTGIPEEAERADAYLHPSMCPYLKACLAEGLSLPGFRRHAVFVNACDAMRRLYDTWSELFPDAFVHLVDLPRGNSPRDLDILAGELRLLSRRMSEYFCVEVTGEALLESCRKREEKRSAYLESSAGLPASQRALLSLDLQSSRWEAPRRAEERPDSAGGVPVAVVGNFLNPHGLLRQLETAGADVVLLDICNGDRPFLAPIPVEATGEDPFSQLAAGYLKRSHCARMQDFEGRVGLLLDKLEETGAAGVIYASLKFCDPYIYEFPSLEKALEARGFPVLRLESDYLDAHAGQVSTRVEAFLEMIAGGRGWSPGGPGRWER